MTNVLVKYRLDIPQHLQKTLFSRFLTNVKYHEFDILRLGQLYIGWHLWFVWLYDIYS